MTEFEVECNLKSVEKIKEDVKLLVLEALQEILDTIKSEIKANANIDNNEVWNKAMDNGCKRLRINKDKTFDITNNVKFEGESRDDLEKILIRCIRESSTKSNSYNNKLSDERMRNDIIEDFKNNNFSITVDDLSYGIDEIEEFKILLKSIINQLQQLLIKFNESYSLEIVENQPFNIKRKLDDDGNKQLISNIFGDKRQRQKESFFSIDVWLTEAILYFQKSDVNNGEQLVLVDGLGINQGQIPKGSEKTVAYNRVHAAIQQCNPDIIIYHSRLDTKDDYITDVIHDLNESGYKNRVFVVYGRLDIVLESYCNEMDIDIDKISKEEIEDFRNYIECEYLAKDLIPIDEPQNRYLCDKPCNLINKYESVEEYKEYTPYQILTKIIDDYKGKQKTERTKLNKRKVTDFMDIMKDKSLFGDIFTLYKSKIDEMVPLDYSLLRWNTLECAINSLHNNGVGYGTLYPSIALKSCFSYCLKQEELKSVFEDDYDETLKEFFNQWTNLTHVLIVTFYKAQFSNLKEMRFDRSMRTMPFLTLTDERKHVLRNILYTCFGSDEKNGAGVFQEITEYILTNIMV